MTEPNEANSNVDSQEGKPTENQASETTKEPDAAFPAQAAAASSADTKTSAPKSQSESPASFTNESKDVTSAVASAWLPDSSEETEENWPPDRRLGWGLIALVLWLLLFATGVLIPSEKIRERLGWEPAAEKQKAAKQ
jgi:hypothetical protein